MMKKLNSNKQINNSIIIKTRILHGKNVSYLKIILLSLLVPNINC